MSADPDPDQRPSSRAARITATTVAWIYILGLILPGVAIWSYPSDHRHHEVAVQLRERGVLVPVDDVELNPSSGPMTFTFRADSRAVTTELDDADGITTKNAPSLRALYLPSDPTQVMLERDINYYADEALQGALSAAILGLAPSLLTLAVWLAFGRRPWWRLIPAGALPQFP